MKLKVEIAEGGSCFLMKGVKCRVSEVCDAFRSFHTSTDTDQDEIDVVREQSQILSEVINEAIKKAIAEGKIYRGLPVEVVVNVNCPLSLFPDQDGEE